MKKTITFFIAINTLFLTVLGILCYLTEVGPLRPGHPVYPVQLAGEQWRLTLTTPQPQQAELALLLTERRLVHLAQAENPRSVHLAAASFERILTQTAEITGRLSPPVQAEYQRRFAILLAQADLVVSALAANDAHQPETIALAEKIMALQAGQDVNSLTVIQPTENGLIPAASIPFLDNEVDHTLYPLTGKHAQIECVDCHPTGQYTHSPTQCEVCHPLPAQSILQLANISTLGDEGPLYPNHFPGECTDCHTTDNWVPYQFNHIGISECESCHLSQMPAGHYPGACLTCHPDVRHWENAAYTHPTNVAKCQSCHQADAPFSHYLHLDGPAMFTRPCETCHDNPADWAMTRIDHTATADCQTCHQDDAPANHQAGLCSQCHSVQSWAQAQFVHPAGTRCVECHTSPANHYPGTCLDCHPSTITWRETVFEHSPAMAACEDCHATLVQSTHYHGRCAQCHTSTAWNKISFDHTNLPNCDTCHEQPRHYDGQCSLCHTTDSWQDYRFNHTGLTECQQCHYKSDHNYGRCAKCHTTTTWDEVNFIHAMPMECEDCHHDREPVPHYPSECSNCHNPSQWSAVSVDHTQLNVCRNCHIVADSHYPGECLACHTPDSWYHIIFDHTGRLPSCETCHVRPEVHYVEPCEVCHTPTLWTEITFDHTNYPVCSACHTIEGHWPGECSACHITDNWLDVDFDHSTNSYTNCKACHSDDRPAGHKKGQCSNCHTTESWDDGLPPVEESPAEVTEPEVPGIE